MAQKIVAAGGIVENENGAILFIYRRGKWDLPKGKVDNGETVEDCAVREVEEETGLRNIERGEMLTVSNHSYEEKGQTIDKETWWYAMKVFGEQKLVPQLDEDISEMAWVQETELAPFLNNTYPNIVKVVEQYFDQGNQVN